jgi:hypothetical protein
MKEQLRILAMTACVFGLAVRLSGCASAPAPAPRATPTVPPSATVSKVPPAIPAAATTAASRIAPSPASAADTSKTMCLECHSYDDVIAASADYVMPSGEKASPHRYIDATSAAAPHRATGVEGIPECTNCHTAHALPLPAEAVDLSKVGVEWCYSNCHHQHNFSPCSKCHEGEGAPGPMGDARGLPKLAGGLSRIARPFVSHAKTSIPASNPGGACRTGQLGSPFDNPLLPVRHEFCAGGAGATAEIA